MYLCQATKQDGSLCTWQGTKLRYNGHDKLPRGTGRDVEGNTPLGGGVCPRCGTYFDGTRHPSNMPDFYYGITPREYQVLEELRAANDEADRHVANGYAVNTWVRPLDIGGHNGSHHSYTLARLVEKGLAFRHQRSGLYSRGSWEYRINDAGRARLIIERDDRRKARDLEREIEKMLASG